EQVVDAHDGVVGLFAVVDCEGNAAIHHDGQLCGVDVFAAGHAHGVRTRQYARTIGRLKRGGGRRRHARRLASHAPTPAGDAAAAVRRHGVDPLAFVVQNLDLHAAEDVPLFLVVGDCGGVGGIRA